MAMKGFQSKHKVVRAVCKQRRKASPEELDCIEALCLEVVNDGGEIAGGAESSIDGKQKAARSGGADQLQDREGYS